MTRQTLNPCASSQTLRAFAIVAMIGAAAPWAAADDDQAPRLPRVRSDDPSISAVVHDATLRSATFRQLVETIDGSDGLVYVEQGKCGHGVRACLLMSVTIAGPYRVLRILVGNTKPDCTLMASIGHELRHAVEALRNPSVRSNPAIYSFFQQEGPTDKGRFETEAAVHAGLDVDRQCGHVERLLGSVAPKSATKR